jgi:hypothetical protein
VPLLQVCRHVLVSVLVTLGSLVMVVKLVKGLRVGSGVGQSSNIVCMVPHQVRCRHGGQGQTDFSGLLAFQKRKMKSVWEQWDGVV